MSDYLDAIAARIEESPHLIAATDALGVDL